MKVRLIFIAILLLLQVNFLFPQCISVELSVAWEMENHIYYKDPVVNIPKLNITYRNNCDSNYYFLKVSNSKDCLPSFGCLVAYYPFDEKSDCIEKINYNAKRYANRSFNVRITKHQMYQSHVTYWSAYYDIIDTEKERYETINCVLQGIHESIRNNNDLENLKVTWGPKWQFEPQDVIPENIVDSVSDQFVFLRSGETYTNTYNLVVFQIIEGCYTFVIDQEDIKNYVLSSERIITDKKNPIVNSKDEVTPKVIWHELALPPVVGDYQLYSGRFNTNKVTVCFGGK